MLLFCAAAPLLVGCPPRAKCPETFLSLDELISEHNANAAAVERLWARAKLAVTFADEKGRTHSWGSTLLPPSGTLLLAKGPSRLGPHYFVLCGRETGVEIFRLGSSPDEGLYYFWAQFGGRGHAWYGRHRLAGGPGVEGLPIDPNQLLAVLGIFELPEDLTKLPAVALRMSTDPCAYVVTYVDRQPVTNRVVFRREVLFRWSEKEPPRPFQVNLFAPDGRQVMTASLKHYKPIDTGEEGLKPVMPTDIKIDWVDWPRKAAGLRSIHMILSGMTTAAKGQPRQACLYRANLPRGLPEVQVDRHLEAKGDER